MKNKLTRRQLASTMLATVAAAQAPSAAPANPQAELDAARQQNQRTAETLSKVDTPISMEPAFHFTA
ncbi:MAG TPA: hypothetical protein VMI94_03240 [Bryobacteraceae bacterium]|nr:hypothetical protein [Bryobacteraceae bacterium]